MYYKGVVTLENYVEHKCKLTNDPQYNVAYNYIEDYSDATFNVTDEDVKAYVEFAVAHENYTRKTALITSTPNNVVIGFLYDFYKGGQVSKVDVFSTIASAIDWCELSLKVLPFIENEFALLKKSCK